MMQAMQQETATQTMTKKQAAEFLGRSERSVSVYMSKDQLPYELVSGPHGRELAFKLSDLERLKADMQTPVSRGEVVGHAVMQNTHAAPVRLHRMPSSAALQTAQAASLPQVREDVIERMIQAVSARPDSIADLSVKLVLTLADAQRLAGIPKTRIIAAIKTSCLRGFRGELGRGWRVKRADLDLWIASL